MIYAIFQKLSKSSLKPLPDPTSILPDEILLKIFQYLSNWEVLYVSVVNGRWRKISQDTSLLGTIPTVVNGIKEKVVLTLNSQGPLILAEGKWLITEGCHQWSFNIFSEQGSWILETEIGRQWLPPHLRQGRSIIGCFLIDTSLLLLVSDLAEFEIWDLENRKAIQSISYRKVFYKKSKVIQRVVIFKNILVVKVSCEDDGKSPYLKIFELASFCFKDSPIFNEVNISLCYSLSQKLLMEIDWNLSCKDRKGRYYYCYHLIAQNYQWTVVTGKRRGHKHKWDLVVLREDIRKVVVRIENFWTRKCFVSNVFLFEQMLCYKEYDTHELKIVFLPRGHKESLKFDPFGTLNLVAVTCDDQGLSIIQSKKLSKSMFHDSRRQLNIQRYLIKPQLE